MTEPEYELLELTNDEKDQAMKALFRYVEEQKVERRRRDTLPLQLYKRAKGLSTNPSLDCILIRRTERLVVHQVKVSTTGVTQFYGRRYSD